MSFSQSFCFGVSGSVHYPASEHGGTVSYSDSVHVEVYVDTSEFDRSVCNCDQAVGELCNAVVNESARLIEEKKNSARCISSSLISGFFKYLMYGIREKIMQLTSRLPALQLVLRELATNCKTVCTQLERDYQRITSRYTAIFNDLDTSLKTALVALDRPVFQITALAHQTVFENDLGGTMAFVPVSGNEESNTAAAIQLARLKSATRDVVSDVARNIRYNIDLASRIEHMLRRSAIPGKHAYCMPVIKFTADVLDAGGECHDEYFFPDKFPSSPAGILMHDLHYGLTDGSENVFRQTICGEDAHATVDSFFKKRLSVAVSQFDDAAYGVRFSNEVLRLWNAVGSRHDASADRLVKTGT